MTPIDIADTFANGNITDAVREIRNAPDPAALMIEVLATYNVSVTARAVFGQFQRAFEAVPLQSPAPLVDVDPPMLRLDQFSRWQRVMDNQIEQLRHQHAVLETSFNTHMRERH